MVQRSYLKYNYKNKKAFIFTMDVAVALIVVFALLATASFFVVRKSQDPLPNLQLLRAGSDLIILMENNGLLDNPDPLTISLYLNENLPPRYGMQLEGYGGAGCTFTAGDTPPDKETIVSGKEYFEKNGDYCALRYKVWLE